MYERKVCENNLLTVIGSGHTLAEWQEAEAKARKDRLRLATLVATGQVMRVRGERAIVLPPRVNTAIRPNKRKAKRR